MALVQIQVRRGYQDDNLANRHNVRIGKGCIIVSQVGISVAPKLRFRDDRASWFDVTLKVGSRSKIAAQSGVMRNVDPGGTIGGSPAKPMRDWLKEVALVDRLVKNKSR